METHGHTKVNVRTGKKGYHKRIKRGEKSVEQVAEVFSGEVALGENAAERHFTMATKEVIDRKEAIDVSTLMFFQCSLVGHTTPALANHAHSTASSSWEGAQAAVPASSDVKQECKSDPESSESEDANKGGPASTGNLFTQLKFAMPKAKQDALRKKEIAAGAKAAASARASLSSAAKAKGKPGKRKGGEDGVQIFTLEDPPMQRALKRHREAMSGNQAEREHQLDETEPALDPGDQKIADEFQEKVNSKKESFANILDGDNVTNDALKACGKDLGALSAQIKGKIKSLNRRTGKKDSSALKQKLETILAPLTDAITLSQGLMALSGEDREHLDTMSQLKTQEWKFSDAVWKRAFKAAMVSHLKYEHWSMMTSGTRDSMIELLGREQGINFFNISINDVVQRLLRHIPASKASRLKVQRSDQDFFCIELTILDSD